MITKPSIAEVAAMDLSPLYKFAIDNDDNRRLLLGEAGVEHYKLLAWIANQFNDKVIVEVGTLGGVGTIALSHNPNNRVVSFDIRSYDWGNQTPPNAEKKLVHDRYMDEVVQASVIFYDAAHEGEEEQEFFDELVERDWKGVLILDDIHLNKEMEEFWSNIPDQFHKEDWTNIGHACGTGVVYFE